MALRMLDSISVAGPVMALSSSACSDEIRTGIRMST